VAENETKRKSFIRLAVTAGRRGVYEEKKSEQVKNQKKYRFTGMMEEGTGGGLPCGQQRGVIKERRWLPARHWVGVSRGSGYLAFGREKRKRISE